MKKIELLSPAGNLKSLYFAVHNGADAVYIGGKKYGARSYANNFNEEEIIDAIKYCHLYGVKLYVTINTIIFDNEIEEFINYVKFLYNNNIDAVIMQDIGMIRKVRELIPDLNIHASTQLHNNNEFQIKLLEELGIKRVVFARELSIDDINKINSNIEKEVFVHGAICVSYSGRCLFSSMNNSRSGNRGECVASCRLRYKLLQNDKNINLNEEYLLSTKELNTINSVDRLIECGIDSLKIEGRMKSPEYVGFITKMYRNAIDSYYHGEKYIIDKENLKNMMTLYNREYTQGYLFGEYGNKLMNIKSPNHQGLPIGKVVNITKNKITIKLYEDLTQEDGIRFVEEQKGMIVNRLYDQKGLLVKKVRKNNVAVIDNRLNITKACNINKTIDKELIDELNKIQEKKIPIEITINARKNKELELIVNDYDDNFINLKLGICEEGKNVFLSYDDIEKQIRRVGNSAFYLNNLVINMDDDIFVPNRILNEIRRTALDKLKQLRENKPVNKKVEYLNIKNRTLIKENSKLNVLVRTTEQIKAAISCGVDNIYVTDYSLYKQYKSNNVYYVLPGVITNYIDYKNENLLVRELGSIKKYKNNNNLVSDYTLNISNIEGIKLLYDLGVNRICLSPEVKLENYLGNDYNTEFVVYGRVELMISKYCLVNMIVNKDNNKCSLCKFNKYTLLDQNGYKYPIINEKHCMVILDRKNIDYSQNINEILSKIKNIRIDLFDEDYNKTIEIINKFRRM